jgi:hypothetical protein
VPCVTTTVATGFNMSDGTPLLQEYQWHDMTQK